MDTWINGQLVTIDEESLWRETFAYWDCRVPTAIAAKIATATEKIIFDSMDLVDEDCDGLFCCADCGRGECCTKNNQSGFITDSFLISLTLAAFSIYTVVAIYVRSNFSVLEMVGAMVGGAL